MKMISLVGRSRTNLIPDWEEEGTMLVLDWQEEVRGWSWTTLEDPGVGSQQQDQSASWSKDQPCPDKCTLTDKLPNSHVDLGDSRHLPLTDW